MRHTDRAHAPFAPSSAERWLACPMAVRYAEQLPSRASSAASDFGTRCHELAEQTLRAAWDDVVLGAAALTAAQAWCTQWNHIEDPPSVIADEMLGVVNPYVAYIESRTREGVIRRLEERVTIVGKDCWGSLDCSLYTPFEVLEIVDLKSGKGACVDPDHNEQLLTYAAGEAERNDWAFDRVVLTIVQPRRTDGKPAVLSWECSAEDVRAHLKRVKAAIKDAKAIDAQPVAGEHCHWCPAKVLCPAQRKQALAVLGEDPGEKPALTLPDAGSLTPEQLSRIVQHRKAVEKWLEECWAYALTNPPPGWKVVAGNTKRRVCLDADGLEAALLLEGLDPAPFMVRKTVGVGEAEKLLKRLGRTDLGAALFDKPPGQPTLAPIGDPRPPIDPVKGLPDLSEDA